MICTGFLPDAHFTKASQHLFYQLFVRHAGRGLQWRRSFSVTSIVIHADNKLKAKTPGRQAGKQTNQTEPNEKEVSNKSEKNFPAILGEVAPLFQILRKFNLSKLFAWSLQATDDDDGEEEPHFRRFVASKKIVLH